MIVIVAGALANKPSNGGEAWVRLSWALGLRRLGCDVFFVEQLDSGTCVDADGRPASFSESVNRSYFERVVSDFDLAASSALLLDGPGVAVGIPPDQLLEIAESADLLVNISGHLTLEPLFSAIRRRAYVDLDPGFTQFWHAQGISGARLEAHDVFFTVGENVGRPDCPIPTKGILWRPVRQPVVLDDWPVSEQGDTDRFTTVATWRGPYGSVEHEGRIYGLKLHKFREVLGLPGLAPFTFEIALSIDRSDRRDLESLRTQGWRLIDPDAVAATPADFRHYVQGSGAEFSVAQGVYVDTRSGWFSDRSARYLASGKPVLVQDTGFGDHLPIGEGLLSFASLEEAADGAHAIARDYERHRRAARELAEAHFDSDRVLSRFLNEATAA